MEDLPEDPSNEDPHAAAPLPCADQDMASPREGKPKLHTPGAQRTAPSLVCQVEGCGASLSSLKEYYQRVSAWAICADAWQAAVAPCQPDPSLLLAPTPLLVRTARVVQNLPGAPPGERRPAVATGRGSHSTYYTCTTRTDTWHALHHLAAHACWPGSAHRVHIQLPCPAATIAQAHGIAGTTW